MSDHERRSLMLSKVDAGMVYEGLLLLALFAAKNPTKPLPYNVASIDALKARVLNEAWPELAATYRGNRRQRRAGKL